MPPRATAVALLAVLAFLPARAIAQTSDNVLLVVNSNSPQSIQIADRYATVRHVPERNIVRIKTTVEEMISRTDYGSTIEAPIATWLSRQRLQDQILYIVVTKGVPLRVDGSGGQTGTVASVDAELTLLYRRMTGAPVSVAGRLDNPYFLAAKPITAARHFSRDTSDLYLVTRLDGFTVDDVLKLIDRGANPVRDGAIVLDQKANLIDRGGDAWLAEAAERLTAMQLGPRVQLETTRAIAASTSPVLGYFSWGSNDRDMGLTFANGAIGGMYVSTDGRTFREPSAAWRPAVAGSATGGQSLVGDLIREGITGVSGHVAEPYLDSIIRPQILFPAYLSGFNLAESFYLAMPNLSWQDIVIGDPLCSPFESGPAGAAGPSGLPAEALAKAGPFDADTGLPALFAERQLALLKSSNLKVEALKLYLKAQNLKAQERPEAEVLALVTQAAALEPRLTFAQLQLALAAEARGDFDEAIVRYRAIVAVEPDNVAVLNNLAYMLVDRRNLPKEALPLAERAYRLSGQTAVVGDTLGWAHYKNGDAAAALPYIDRAARLEPKNADILIHAATIHAELKDLAAARTYLDAALKLDPKLADRQDVKALILRIR
jgi:uncharacterized protein (TIGR03790 family)